MGIDPSDSNSELETNEELSSQELALKAALLSALQSYTPGQEKQFEESIAELLRLNIQ